HRQHGTRTIRGRGDCQPQQTADLHHRLHHRGGAERSERQEGDLNTDNTEHEQYVAEVTASLSKQLTSTIDFIRDEDQKKGNDRSEISTQTTRITHTTWPR